VLGCLFLCVIHRTAAACTIRCVHSKGAAWGTCVWRAAGTCPGESRKADRRPRIVGEKTASRPKLASHPPRHPIHFGSNARNDCDSSTSQCAVNTGASKVWQKIQIRGVRPHRPAGPQARTKVSRVFYVQPSQAVPVLREAPRGRAAVSRAECTAPEASIREPSAPLIGVSEPCHPEQCRKAARGRRSQVHGALSPPPTQAFDTQTLA
jgi:hypothetical protein